jgi:Tat protein translocase TatB subunit
MFGTLGGPELILILVVALIVFGPRKLPEMGKSLGKMMLEFRRASNDFRRTIEDEVETEKLREATRMPSLDTPASTAASVAPLEAPPGASPADADAPLPPPPGTLPQAERASTTPGSTEPQAPVDPLPAAPADSATESQR